MAPEFRRIDVSPVPIIYASIPVEVGAFLFPIAAVTFHSASALLLTHALSIAFGGGLTFVVCGSSGLSAQVALAQAPVFHPQGFPMFVNLLQFCDWLKLRLAQVTVWLNSEVFISQVSVGAFRRSCSTVRACHRPLGLLHHTL